MGFVKLDTAILNSTLWYEKMCRDLFLTALLMAEPFELADDTPQLRVRTAEETGWKVPAGWYGLVKSSGIGIIDRAKTEDVPLSFSALEQLGEPEEASKSTAFEGRRLVRIDGGFIVLNYFKYRDRDYSAADRQRRLRERRKLSQRNGVTSQSNGVTSRIAEAQADAETDAELLYQTYPRHVAKPTALKAIERAMKRSGNPNLLLEKTKAYAEAVKGTDPAFIPYPATWFNQERYNDDPAEWSRKSSPAGSKATRSRGEFKSSINKSKLVK